MPTGLTIDSVISEILYQPLILPQKSLVAAKAAAVVVGSDHVVRDARPVMTSEDFGYMLQQKSGAYILLGNGEEGVGGCSLHNPSYDFNDEILSIGADFWVELVQSELKQ